LKDSFKPGPSWYEQFVSYSSNPSGVETGLSADEAQDSDSDDFDSVVGEEDDVIQQQLPALPRDLQPDSQQLFAWRKTGDHR
jgi:hypothetical protein